MHRDVVVRPVRTGTECSEVKVVANMASSQQYLNAIPTFSFQTLFRTSVSLVPELKHTPISPVCRVTTEEELASYREQQITEHDENQVTENTGICHLIAAVGACRRSNMTDNSTRRQPEFRQVVAALSSEHQ
jgi:hypothetical protein